jgi:N-acetylmuramoyl-L-alanine amidase
MKIAIDAGHGMSNRQAGLYDPGATHVEAGFRFEEAEIALRYALALREALAAHGAAVFLTREDAGDHAPLGERAANARLAGAGGLLSLHVNSVEDAARTASRCSIGATPRSRSRRRSRPGSPPSPDSATGA